MSGISFAKALVSFHVRHQNVIREKENCVHKIRKCNLYGSEGKGKNKRVVVVVVVVYTGVDFTSIVHECS
jgi:hypothetical protein